MSEDPWRTREATVQQERLGRLLCTDSPDELELLVAIRHLAASRGWQYVMLVAIRSEIEVRLGLGQPPHAVLGDLGDILAQVLIQCQHISEALIVSGFMALAPGDDPESAARNERAARAIERIAVSTAPLIGRRWTIRGSDRAIGRAAIVGAMRAVHKRGRRMPPERRATWMGKAGAKQLHGFNQRIRDTALYRIVAQNGGRIWSDWRKAVARSPSRACFLSVRYDATMVRAALSIDGEVFDSAEFGPMLYLRLTGMGSSDYLTAKDEQIAFIRHVSSLCCMILAGAYAKDDAVFQSASQVFYGLFLRQLISRPDVQMALRRLGERPVLVVSTHGALRHVPFAAIFDGERYLSDQFDIVQASPTFHGASAAMDWSHLAGGAPVTRPVHVNVYVDEAGLEQGWAEVQAYEALAKRLGVGISRPGVTRWGLDDLRGVLARPGVTVLSCHAHADALGAVEATLALPSGERPSMRQLMEIGIGAETLVLAGCNSANQTDWLGEDGTNVADYALRAGAASVVTTLWPIDDLAGRVFNTAFVEALASGMGRAQACGAAQRAVRVFRPTALQRAGLERKLGSRLGGSDRDDHFDKPYYWAPFMLAGSWS